MNGEYGVKGIYAGVPVIIGKNGVEKIIEIKLSDYEKKQFDQTIKSVKDLFDAGKKIDKSLNNLNFLKKELKINIAGLFLLVFLLFL